jgi:hypothetical protein
VRKSSNIGTVGRVPGIGCPKFALSETAPLRASFSTTVRNISLQHFGHNRK